MSGFFFNSHSMLSFFQEKFVVILKYLHKFFQVKFIYSHFILFLGLFIEGKTAVELISLVSAIYVFHQKAAKHQELWIFALWLSSGRAYLGPELQDPSRATACLSFIPEIFYCQRLSGCVRKRLFLFISSKNVLKSLLYLRKMF